MALRNFCYRNTKICQQSHRNKNRGNTSQTVSTALSAASKLIELSIDEKRNILRFLPFLRAVRVFLHARFRRACFFQPGRRKTMRGGWKHRKTSSEGFACAWKLGWTFVLTGCAFRARLTKQSRGFTLNSAENAYLPSKNVEMNFNHAIRGREPQAGLQERGKPRMLHSLFHLSIPSPTMFRFATKSSWIRSCLCFSFFHASTSHHHNKKAVFSVNRLKFLRVLPRHFLCLFSLRKVFHSPGSENIHSTDSLARRLQSGSIVMSWRDRWWNFTFIPESRWLSTIYQTTICSSRVKTCLRHPSFPSDIHGEHQTQSFFLLFLSD